LNKSKETHRQSIQQKHNKNALGGKTNQAHCYYFKNNWGADSGNGYLSFVSLYLTCFLATGSNFMISSFSGFARLFLVVV
jgi:hypothetical protein